MNKRIRRALRLTLGIFWLTVKWLFAAGKPWRKRPRSAFTRISLTTILALAAYLFGRRWIETWHIVTAFTVLFAGAVCLPEGDDEEEIDDTPVLKDDEDYEIVMTVKYTELGPKAYFDDPLNPSHTHIIDLRQVNGGEEFAA